jgi:hypothetical protein
VPHGMLQVFIIILYENVFQNPQILTSVRAIYFKFSL